MELLVHIVLILYLVVSSVLFLYGVHAYLMTFLFIRARREPLRAPPLPRDLPPVTVQLPIYNELYVVNRLIEAAYALDYPRHLLEIQILDDSTDETTDLIHELVERGRAQGLDMQHVRRGTREGFKAGALREGLLRAKGTLLAIFDADFVPPSDFLLRTVPHFEDPRIGMVQTRWGHINEDYSVLTRAQAVALDGHFLVEQTARHRSGCFISFNGTAGIWRRECVLDAGNWQDDTLTEDLDLSYRAQLRHWRFVFMPDLVCPAELPSEVNALKRQQYRWAKGSAQTMRKLLPHLLRSRIPWRVKTQGVVHLTVHFVYPLLVLLSLCAVPLVLIISRYREYDAFFKAMSVFVLASLGHPILYASAQRALHRQSWRMRLLVLPVTVAVGMGIALNNTRGILEGLLGKASAFERTPKYHIERRGDRWRGKKYRVPSSPLAMFEIGLALYIFCGILLAIRVGQYPAIPYLALYGLGFLYFGALSALQAWPLSSALAGLGGSVRGGRRW
jgi:cellulose synthase/poly-beta-1,6-N-acetylglucosamine synthase-like glycosyltransferase